MGMSSYTIHLTDLANLWTESLDRKAICMRGWKEDTSLDPSDSPANMAKFLASIRAALDAGEPGHYDTSMQVMCGSAAEAGHDGLGLTLTCPVAGFAPLKWPLYLKKAPCSSIATHLVLPLFQACHARKRQVDTLLQAMQHKDMVVSKLADKLHGMGLGLDDVLTALAGKGKATGLQAGSKVKALAPFDQTKWQEMLKSEPQSIDPADVIEGALQDADLDCSSMVELDESCPLDTWWSGVEGTIHITYEQTPHSPRQNSKGPVACAGNQVADDDDFQVQTTPPGLASREKGRKSRVSEAIDDGWTADQDEEAVPHCHGPASYPTASSSGPKLQQLPSRLNTTALQGKPSAAATRHSLDSVAKECRGEAATEGSMTASEDEAPMADDDATASEVESLPDSPQPTRAKAVTELNSLGVMRGDEADGKETQAATERKQNMLGVIGGETEQGHDSRDGQAKAEEWAGETSQERANRRRQELKRELEKKAAAGPSKKKRRF
ncbi:hypothetical protein CDD82_1705 [Ophiocordyceps australis]|uniref:Non-homologous end-joining factor 1 n=1 Tax=Ophiocordyceps australis TaxID=1399860 RepID=A0A2C5YDG4_9HYPO|nr:hypothetical protein CDD82_1705 [Ophiocordyceps australis]